MGDANQQGNPSDSGQTPQPQQPNQGQQQGTDQQHGNDDADYKGAGGKAALLSDLTEERTKRQELERTVTEMRNGFAKALGIEQAQSLTPEQMAEKVQAANRSEADAKRQLAIYQRAGQVGANPTALLDSASFLSTAAQIPAGDTAALDQAIRAAVEANPALAVDQKGPGAGWSDTQQGRNTPMTSADQEALTILGFGG